MKRQSGAISMACCALAFLLLSGTVHSAEKQEELENLRKRISSMQEEIAKTSENKSEAADALRESEKAISDSNRKLAELGTQKKKADHKLDSLQTQQQDLKQQLSKQQALLGKLLYQQYLGGKHEYLKLMLNNQNPNQLARDLQYYQYIARNRSAWLGKLRNNLLALDTVRSDVLTQSSELQKLHEQQAAQKEKLQQDQSERKKVLGEISKQLKQQRREISRMQRNENRLSQLVNKITKMLAQPKTSTLFKNDNLPDNRFDGEPFAKLKGKLALPVKGSIANKFGSTRPDSTVLWKGLLILSANGQPVKSVAAGRVVFADWLRGFGNLLIVDHGNAYMSLYGNNETLYKQVGDEVRGGDTIAAVGNSGGNANSGLYFELRHQSKPLDPMQWVAIK